LQEAPEPPSQPEDLATSLAFLSDAMSRQDGGAGATAAPVGGNRESAAPLPTAEPSANGHGLAPLPVSEDSLTALRATLLQMASLLGNDGKRAPVWTSAAADTQPLRDRRIALVNFQTDQSVELRSAIESQGGVAASLMLSSTTLSLVCQVFDMVVWAIPTESDIPNEGQIQELESRRKPTLWVGSRQWVVPLVSSQPPGLWDYVESLHPLDHAVWRVGMQVNLNQNHRGSSGARRRAGQETALVLDDNTLSRALVERTLAATGLTCLRLPEEVPALEFIRQSRPSVVVMELKTSTEQGFDLLQRIRQELNLASTRVVVLSEQREEADVVRAFGLGVDDFVTKPFSPLELAARVTRLVRLV